MHWQPLRIHSQQWEPKGDRQTDRTPSVPATPSLLSFGEPDPVLPGGQKPASTPTEAAHSPGTFQASILREFHAVGGLGLLEEPGRCGDLGWPQHSHHLPEPEHNLGGSRGPPCREGIQPTAGTAWAWQSIKDTQIPQPGIPNLPHPGCCELTVLGEGFFFPSWEENPCGITTKGRGICLKRQQGSDLSPLQ